MYQRKGAAAIEELDGMFGLAIWDPRKRELVLARDRAGEKPLFYTRIDDEVWFA
jgi:asparagine synthase (glutamine-hydrolysing)